MRVFESLDALRSAIGEDLGTSDWHTVTQEQINTFADATGDHQWIHVDVARAAQGPFGTTIAHGFLTLALLPMLTHQVYTVNGISMAINYGCNRVRFPAPLPSGSRVRAHVTVVGAEDIPGGLQVVTVVQVEVENGAKPCCVAEAVSRFLA
ncbi:MAG: MaoC family dehydratase [Candidatus Dormibacteraeota bacterium]|nr:MaoC family dehydratase [Candidatus Dormibacteraeota bacterium]